MEGDVAFDLLDDLVNVPVSTQLGPYVTFERGARSIFGHETGGSGHRTAVYLRSSAPAIPRHSRHGSRVPRHRRAKTDRLDTELLKRAFLGWLRGERGHCSMARVPTIAEEDAKRPNRERDCPVYRA
jgi:transposase